MIAVMYRSYVKSGREEEYQILWKRIATYFVEKRGAIGSCLHKTEEGYWLIYSRWPNSETRDNSWPGEDAPSDILPDNIKQAILDIKDCVDQNRKFPEICMKIKGDLL
jgi:hypothetical protein